MSRPKDWFEGLSTGGKIGTVIGGCLATVITLGIVSAATHAPTPTSPPTSPTIETKTITDKSAVDFQTENKDDATLAKGQTKIEQAGVKGERTITYKVTYTDGQETSREKISDEITTQPITQIVDVGSYVYVAPATNCPNGTYTNTAGNVVCSPYSAPSAPAGATAQCVDGSYSFSQSRSGTCSHHGGVSVWL